MAGTITYSNPGGQSVYPSFASGKIVADGAATYVECGFKPSMIVIYNDTDDTSFEWFVGVPEGSMFQTAATGDKTLIAGGPTVWDGDADNDFQGWLLPATAVINTASDVLYWKAFR